MPNISLTQDTLSQYFTIANSENSWLEKPTNLYNFVNRNSDVLLVTIGDSWTWGSDISINNKDDSLRVASVYGNILSNKVSADWLNLAISAQGNFWMADMVQELCEIIPKLHYKKIYVICTFTGIGRWFNTRFDTDIDYISWFRQNIKKTEDFDKLLIMLNERCVNKILDCTENFSHVELKVATNFVDHLGFDRLHQPQIIPTPWYQVIGLSDVEKVYTCMYYDRLATATEFIPRKYYDNFKIWFLELYEKSNRRLSIIKDAPGFRNCHPTTDGHVAWANYLLQHL
jgi:hypothetical protein